MSEVQSGTPSREGYYLAWDIVTGYSSKAYWNMHKWIFPDDFPVDPNWDHYVEWWQEL